MKALIFNSGIGKRMGELTAHSHKSLVELNDGESIFERQIRVLSECGITQFVVTTGLYEDRFKAVSDKYKNIDVTYVNNPFYNKSNYIYSLYLAREYLDDDILMLHGDLVFNKGLVKKILASNESSLVTIDSTKPLPEKDFKGRVKDGKLREVSIKIFDDDCYALQPFYKLSKKDIGLWLDRVVEFIEKRDERNVYAENALNEISDQTNIIPFDASSDFVEEIDNLEDYERVKSGIRLFDFREQEIHHSFADLKGVLKGFSAKKPMVVLDKFLLGNLPEEIDGAVYFSSFKSNPLYEDVLKGIELFKKEGCDSLVSIGGGSAIDVAKAIKLFLPLDGKELYLDQKPKYINLKHVAIPTTAGTGSESTRYSVVYYEGKKQSLTADFLVPEACILDPAFLLTLPYKQKAATLMDALCHGIESLWSVNATGESRVYSKKAISSILSNIDAYLNGDHNKNPIMLEASNAAGKAINLTQTTAAHAMSYKITSMYGLPHGQAVAICLEAMLKTLGSKLIESPHPLGDGYLNEVFEYLETALGVKDEKELGDAFGSIVDKCALRPDIKGDEAVVEELAASINPIRLKNFPLTLTDDEIRELYRSVLSKD